MMPALIDADILSRSFPRSRVGMPSSTLCVVSLTDVAVQLTRLNL
jgi:hypothetical protein